MIKINLLPYRAARKKENIRKQVSIYFLSIILLILILFVIDFNAKREISELNAKVTASQTELKGLRKKAKEVDKIKKELDSLNSKLEIIDSLKKGRKSAITVLKEITEVIVGERMWVTTFNFEQDSFYFEGMALDDRTVADFMRNLERSKVFKNIELKSITSTMIRDVELRKFIIRTGVEKKK